MVKTVQNKVLELYEKQREHHSLRFRKSSHLDYSSGDLTIDDWTHARMHTFTDPITKADYGATWLTVGDGRYGREAHYLLDHGADALATDISDDFLEEAKKKNFIKKYKKENAEKLSFKDQSFDYVFCKESFHHFPRPPLALYEMLRVARKAVILIEPNDVKKRGFSWNRFWSVDDLKSQVNRFETSGNYVYATSRREIEKVALGINLPAIAFGGLDDIYMKKAGGEKIADNTLSYRKIKFFLLILNILYRLNLRDRSLLVSVIFIKKPTRKIVQAMKHFGYNIITLPVNPYVK